MGPFAARFDERVDDSDEFSGDSCYDELVWFPGGTESVSEAFEKLIVMACDERSLEHHMP